LRLIVAPQLSGGWQHDYSNKTRLAGHTNKQSMYYLMSMINALNLKQNIRTKMLYDHP